MEKGLRTKVDIKALNAKLEYKKFLAAGRVNNTIKFCNKDTDYIVKAYEVDLGFETAGAAEQGLNLFQIALQENMLQTQASQVSQHFAKPLGIDWVIEHTKDEKKLFIESLFEYGGPNLNEVINKPDYKFSLEKVYDWMRQTALALATLHNIGIAHFDVRPTKIVHNPTTGIVKFIDFGFSAQLQSRKRLYEPVGSLFGIMRDYSCAFSAPEALRSNMALNKKGEVYVPGAVDTYSWALTFYSILMKKSAAELDADAKTYKIFGEAEYTKFLTKVQSELESLPVANEHEKTLKDFIVKNILPCLLFDPQKREVIGKVIENMSTIKTSASGCEEMEGKWKTDLMASLFLETKGKETVVLEKIKDLKVDKE